MKPAFPIIPLAVLFLSELIPSSSSIATNTTHAITHELLKRDDSVKHDGEFIAFACLIPVLVILSGVFAGLTLGYMSLDETQLKVLSLSGSP